MLTDGQKYKVDKNRLLTILRDNREKHVREFKEATAEFRKQAIALLSAELSHARDGEPFKLIIALPKPRSFASQYDQVVGLLELTKADEVEMNLTDYRSLVLDKWDWKRQFKMSTSNYIADNGPGEDGED